MRIGVDCRLSGPQHAGIGRYITNLITRLPTLDSHITWVFFVADDAQAEAVKNFTNVEIITVPIRHYSLQEQLQLPKIFHQAKLDLLHVPHFNVPLGYTGPLIVTIHDLLWHEYRGLSVTTLSASKYWLKYAAYRWITTKAITRAKTILVPTKVIKNTVGKYYPSAEEKVVVTYEGVSGAFLNRRFDKKVPNQLPKDKKILLYVGSLYPHKNVSLVINALPQLSEYHLALVGARNVFQDQIRKQVNQLGVTSQVSFLGYLSDAELAPFMSRSHALIQPSLSEGFGLTGIEAMAAGLPVIASDIPVFKEIYGRAAIFFDPHSVTEFVAAIKRLSSMDRQKLSIDSQQQSHKFSWDAMAVQTLKEYRRLVSK